MKKLLYLPVLFVLILSLAGCGATPTPPPGAVETLAQAMVSANAADPASIVIAHFAARNAYDLASAMTFVADDAVFTSPKETATGKADVEKFVNSRIKEGNQFLLSDFQVSGDTVAFSVDVSQEGELVASLAGNALVQGGLIKSMATK